MHKVIIIHKSNSEPARAQAGSLAHWLEGRGVAAASFEARSNEYGARPEAALDLPKDAELAVVLGGDGTMLGAVRELVGQSLSATPVLGINLGGLGFMTALSPEELLPAMEKILQGDFHASPRMMLTAKLVRAGEEVMSATVLNDVVINKAALARIVDLRTWVDDHFLTTFRADGLIVSTPTGSTAYNLSAGGPICHPHLDCICLAPICSFALSNRPLLLGPGMTLTVVLDESAAQTHLTCDGQVGFELEPGDTVVIKRAPASVRIIDSPFRDYFEILRTKLRWG
jgi:NAD+ kinase